MANDAKHATDQISSAHDKAVAAVSSSSSDSTGNRPGMVASSSPSLSVDTTSPPPVTIRCTSGSYWISMARDHGGDAHLDSMLIPLATRLDFAIQSEVARVPVWRPDGGLFTQCGTSPVRREHPPLATCTKCGHSVWSWYCVGERLLDPVTAATTGSLARDALHEPRLLSFNRMDC
jgi:hypothetical protein